MSGIMSVIIPQAVPVHFAGGDGCEQVNPSPSEEAPAFPDMIKDNGDMNQIYCIKIEYTEPTEQKYSSKAEHVEPIEQIYCIKTEDAGPIEQMHSIEAEDVASIEQKNPLILAEGRFASVDQEHHSVQIEDAASSDEDLTMEEKSSEINIQIPEEVCMLLILCICLLFPVYIE